ncbi:MAG: EAL domain-containing protein [Terriglobales bacterium]
MPQVDLATGKIIGAEALLRWRHPELGLVPPNKFIPIAENSGLITPIGEWVLRTACAQARQWQDEGLPAIPVAVNVSAVQFRQDRFLQVITNVLDETGLPPQCLELELTEGLLLSNSDVMLSMLQELKERGLKLSIDDFGTGYSNLSYLRNFPVYKLKIDRSFVQAMTVSQDDAVITSTIINMGRSLNLTRNQAELILEMWSFPDSEALADCLEKHFLGSWVTKRPSSGVLSLVDHTNAATTQLLDDAVVRDVWPITGGKCYVS